LLVLAMVVVLAGSVIASDAVRYQMTEQKALTGNEPLPNVEFKPTPPGLITSSPGDTVGWTYYDYQTNCSTGDRAALGIAGNVNISWMNGIDAGITERQVYFNCVNADGEQAYPGVGTQISEGNFSGYTTIGNLSTDEAVVAYHRTSPIYEVFTAVDAVACFGIFTTFTVDNILGGQTVIWPYITVDRNENFHLVYSLPDDLGDAFGYTNSTDGGATWRRPTQVDAIMTISAITASSPVSDKVAVVYTQDVGQQWRDNVVYYESEDGMTWDFVVDPINITEYGQGGDSLWAYADVDAVYDFDDNLHIIWNAQYVFEDGSYWVGAYLYHYDTGSETITFMAESEQPDPAECSEGAWQLPISKMSLGVHEPTDALFAVYSYFPEDDCSAGGYSNSELYMQYSVDDGASWSEPEDLTNSHTPGCIAGECDSDHWSSLAKRVDDYLHIVYINDKDAGGLPQTEGVATENPVLYMAYPNPVTGIYHEGPVPTTFALGQNYPNPFNARTSIEFELLEDSDVELSVYDVTGAKVVTLADGEMEAGSHSVNWDAKDVASGVYYYSLKANGEQSSRKMTLLK
jgi:hypothetical protein